MRNEERPLIKELWFQILMALILGIIAGAVLSPELGTISTERMQMLAPWIALPGGLIAVAVTTIGASIGTPSTPGVGIIVLGTILQGVGVPPSGIALILGVDRLLDMCRTSLNVTGDLVAVTVMDRWLARQGKTKEQNNQANHSRR